MQGDGRQGLSLTLHLPLQAQRPVTDDWSPSLYSPMPTQELRIAGTYPQGSQEP